MCLNYYLSADKIPPWLLYNYITASVPKHWCCILAPLIGKRQNPKLYLAVLSNKQKQQIGSLGVIVDQLKVPLQVCICVCLQQRCCEPAVQSPCSATCSLLVKSGVYGAQNWGWENRICGLLWGLFWSSGILMLPFLLEMLMCWLL